jgi:hypothetical protein
VTDTPIWIIHEGKYTLFVEAPTLEEAEAMNPFRNSKTRKKHSDSEGVLTNDDVRAILGASGTYSEIAKLFKVSVTTISKIKRRAVRANVPFDGEVAKSSSPPGRKPKGTL